MSYWKKPIDAAKIAVSAPIEDRHRGRTEREEEIEPRHHVDAGGDHRRRVNQRGDRRRSRHRVGEPDVERNLRAFSRRADEEADADDGEHRQTPQRHLLEPAGHSTRLVGDLVAQLAELHGGTERHSSR
jgi:hypothetical protein